MTQSQIKAPDIFYSPTSIASWAGTKNGVLYLNGDDEMPYVEKDELYWYFGLDATHVYSLIATSLRDLGVGR